MNLTIKQAAIPAAVAAFIAANVFGTPEVITMVMFSALGFIAAMAVLLVFCRLVPVSSWPLWKQRLGVWSVAAGAAAAACLIALALAMVKR